ncbi:hypothetical protein ACFRIC_40175 [Streptomyces sp. NPDC056738]|uniref:hypothetical protein n=1 Tax=Streptomyces sp. NPDC056738 TaxID=3345933 RepID=UPI003699966F
MVQEPGWRNRAAADHQIVHDHIARYGEHSAQRLFTRSFVATVQRLSPQSQTMTGTIAEWEQWTGMVFPETGDYVIPGGLSLLRVDQSADQGTYTEPNIWMQHV